MRVAVPPRDVAATVTAQALLRTGWTCAVVLIGLSVVILVDLSARDQHLDELWGPLGSLGIVLVALLLLIAGPNRGSGVFYLGIGSIGCFLYQWLVLADFAEFPSDSVYLINRVAMVLVLVGPVGKKLVGGVWWVLSALLLATASTLLAQWATGMPLEPGWGPAFACAVYIAVILTLQRIRVSQRFRMPDFDRLEAETVRLTGHRQLQEHATALVHDTVLADLDAVSKRVGALDERAVARIRRDLEALEAAEEGAVESDASSVSSRLRDELLAVIRDVQWRGLTVEVTGGDSLDIELSELSREAVGGALFAALENTLDHSESTEAYVDFRSTDEEFVVMVVDNGVGFNPDEVPSDRLGLRTSIRRRIESVGGTVRLWSARGAGTSIVVTVPREESTGVVS